MRIPTLLTVIALATQGIHAQHAPPDSIAFDSLALSREDSIDSVYIHIDSLEMYIDNNKRKYIYHRSEVPVNVFELAHYYGVMSRDILDAERFVRKDTLELKAYLIPADGFLISKDDCHSSKCIPIVYTVRPQETVFRIARRYFDLRIDELRQFNNLETDDLSVGQRLVVGWFTPNTYTLDEQQTSSDLMLVPDEVPEDPFSPEIPKTEVGVAYWNKAQTDYSNLFALHPRARLHSMIEITNPMMQKRVLVKVVGRIPPTYTSDISLVVSPAVATRLGVLDPKFRAELRFVE